MTALLWGFLAAVGAVTYEAVSKHYPDRSWFELLIPLGLICSLTTQYGIYRILHSGESLIGGLVLFSLCTALLRVAYTLATHHEVSTASWVAFALVVAASLVKTVWPVVASST